MKKLKFFYGCLKESVKIRKKIDFCYVEANKNNTNNSKRWIYLVEKTIMESRIEKS